MFEVRTITPDDAELFRRRVSRGFGGDAETDTAAVERFEAIVEYDRTLAAFDGDDIIGTGAGFSLGLTVPGGTEVPMGGTTVVTVQPTHRRRGVLRSLMERHFDDVAERGEPLAGLWASESSIYGRFGYGPATYRSIASIGSPGVDFGNESMKGSLRLVEADEAEPILRSVYEEVRPTRAGMLTRSDAWWTHRRMADPEAWREGKSARRYLVHEEGGSVTGYATYRQKSKWEDFLAEGTVDVIEVFATTSTAHSGIWSFLTNVDLFPNVEWWNMPLDDPLLFKITDSRRVTRKVSDALWVRVMDIPAALSARTYDCDGHLVFGIEDWVRPENTGTYRLEVSDGVGHCERVSGAGEVVVDIDVLGHLYLGAGNALAMAEAGRIEGDPGTVTSLHRIMRTDQHPWCPEVF
ncbi:MAG: GNAT family N-acetyltransferase [Actinomycetota bacterium]